MKNPFNMFSKAAPERSPSDAPVQPQVMYLTSGSAVAIVKWNDRIAASMAMQHPIVHPALDKIASSVQQCRFLVQPDEFALATERTSAAGKMRKLQTVLDNPNNDMLAPMWRYWMGLTFATFGRVPQRVTMGAVDTTVANAIYPLDAGQVYVKQNTRGAIVAYEYGQMETKSTWPSLAAFKQNPTDRGFAFQFWKPGLKGYFHQADGNTPLQSLGLPAQVITSLLRRAIATAEGHPNVRYLVTCSKTLTNDQLKALKQHLNEDHGATGPDAGKVPILQNAADVVIHTLDNDLSDIHSKMPSDDMARLIFGGFGIPIALAGMGAADAAKFASNYIESRSAFWEDTIVPSYLGPIATGLTQALCPPGLVIVPDLDTVPAMMASRMLSMKELKDVAYLTDTEKRSLFGYETTPADLAAIAAKSPKPTTPPTGGQ